MMTDPPRGGRANRGWWLRPLSWRRNGLLLARGVLLLRRGLLRRALVILPLARLQSVRISQGPVDRALRGEGAVLVDSRGRSVTAGVHQMGDLAPRDVVSAAVDARLSQTGDPCVTSGAVPR